VNSSSAAPVRTSRLTGAVAIAAIVIHIALSWGQMPVWWGDTGRWLHEVDRFAHGERLYADFYWPFPPLAMWIIGGLARIAGSDLLQIWTMTSVLSVAIALAWTRFAIRLTGDALALPFVAVVLPLGLAYSATGSAPLAMGMYTPAAPVGFLCLLFLLISTLSLAGDPTRRSAIGVGLFGALCVLSKHDFWIPAFVLVVGAPWLAGARRRAAYVEAWGTAAVVLAAASAFLVAQTGFGVFAGILTGYGLAQEYGGRGSPTLETVVLESAAAALCVAGVSLAVAWTGGTGRRRAAWTATVALVAAAALMAVWILKTVSIAQIVAAGTGPGLRSEVLDQLTGSAITPAALVKTSIKLLRDRLTIHALPALTPLIALAVFLRHRARLSRPDAALGLLLLLAAIALRVRRGMEHVEWTSMLVELPVYVFLARLLYADRMPAVLRASRAVLAAMIPLILWQHFSNGYGPGTRRGPRVAVSTPRGLVRLHPGQAGHYARLKQAVDALDPTGSRPLLSFGYSGSFNYFFRRPPATPLTHGFRIGTVRDPNDAVRQARFLRPPVIGIDSPFWDFGLPVIGVDLFRWQRRERPGPYASYDRPYFEAVVAGCRSLDHAGLEGFTLYDCPQLATSGQ
jgi:hypothetical protein